MILISMSGIDLINVEINNDLKSESDFETFEANPLVTINWTFQSSPLSFLRTSGVISHFN